MPIGRKVLRQDAPAQGFQQSLRNDRLANGLCRRKRLPKRSHRRNDKDPAVHIRMRTQTIPVRFGRRTRYRHERIRSCL